MKMPKIIKDIERLTCRIANLNLFVTRATDKCLPFLKILRKVFVWDEECKKAFKELKTYLSVPVLLSRPI